MNKEESKLFTPIKIENNPLLEKVETVLNLGGIICPFSAILGVGVGFFNKKYAIKNLEIVIDKLNKTTQYLEFTAERIINNERNLTFNVQNILNSVIKERQEEKLEFYKNIILNGLINDNFFDSNDDTIDTFLNILSEIKIDELKVAEFVYDFFEKQKEKNVKMVNLPFLLIRNKFKQYDEHYLNFVLRKLVNMGLLIDNTFSLIGYVGQPYNFTPNSNFDFRSYCYESSQIYENFRYYILNDEREEKTND